MYRLVITCYYEDIAEKTFAKLRESNRTDIFRNGKKVTMGFLYSELSKLLEIQIIFLEGMISEPTIYTSVAIERV